MRGVFSSIGRLAAAALAAVLLAGCVETAGDFGASPPASARATGIPVSLVSLSGAPEPVIARISSTISLQAARRNLQIVGIDGNPRYQLRGFVSAQAGGSGNEIAWAFDIYDAQRRRARRLAGEEAVRADGDVWSSLSDADLQKVANKVLDQIVLFLSDTPEAVASGAGTTAAGSVAGGAVGSFATR